MEPRARAGKNVGKMNFGYGELRQLLYGSGDAREPLPETMRMLDEIATDFIQSLSFEAARIAHYAGRQKIKYDDFEFALRRNPLFLGKVREMFEMSKEVKDARKMPGIGEGNLAKADMNELAKLGDGSGGAGGGGGGGGGPSGETAADDARDGHDARSSVTGGSGRKRAASKTASQAPSQTGGGSKKKKIKLMKSATPTPMPTPTPATNDEDHTTKTEPPADDLDVDGLFDDDGDEPLPGEGVGGNNNSGTAANDGLANLDDDLKTELH